MKTTITPEMANELLQKNTKNRKLNKRHVKSLADEMTAGNWSYTGDSIKVSLDDVLIDGQHRLEAIALSGVSADMELVTNVDADSFAKVDNGAVRTAGQVIAMGGIKDPASVASIAKGMLTIKDQGGIHKGFSYSGYRKFPNHEVAAMADQIIDDLTESNIVNLCKAERIIQPVRLALFYIYTTSNKHTASAFIEHLTSGLFDRKTDPCKRLRDKLVAHQGKGGAVISQECLAITFKAWNSFVTKNECSLLRYSRNESFPVPLIVD